MSSESWCPPDGPALIHQEMFLTELLRTAPEVIDDLKNNFYPHYLEMVTQPNWPKSATTGLGMIEPWHKLQSFRDCLQLKLHVALRLWARKYNLETDWILDAAVQRMHCWYIRGFDFSEKSWTYYSTLDDPLDPPINSEEKRFVLIHAGWPLEEQVPWNEYHNTLRRMFNEQVRAYKRKMIDLASVRDWRTPPRLRNDRQFEWLVRYQVKAESADIIDPGNAHAVDAQVRRTAALIGLELRSGRRGPKKRADKLQDH